MTTLSTFIGLINAKYIYKHSFYNTYWNELVQKNFPERNGPQQKFYDHNQPKICQHKDVLLYVIIV